MDDRICELKNLIEVEMSLTDVSKKMGLSKNKIMGLVNILKEQEDINIVLAKKDDDIYLLNQGQREWNVKNTYKLSTTDNKLKLLLVSDSRMGSIFSQPSILNELYLLAEQEGIKHVIHLGNLTEGLYKMSNKMFDSLFVTDTYSQARYVIDNYPYIEGIKTYFITGSKDQTHLKEKKINIGKKISSGRTDMIYLGNGRCTLYIDNIEMLLLNSNQRKTYTQSYRAQKLIDALRSEDKPNFLIYGGLLQCEQYPYRDVEVLSIPSTCASTWEMEEKAFSNTIGGVILELEIDKKGNLKNFKPQQSIYYVTKENDYKTAKILKRGGK